jgi:hypothetical protein
MLGLRLAVLSALFFAGVLFADASGDGHVHNENTAVGDGSSGLNLGGASNQLPSELAQAPGGLVIPQREIEPLEQPNTLPGNGDGAMRIEDRIGVPGVDPLPGRAVTGMPRSQIESTVR